MKITAIAVPCLALLFQAVAFCQKFTIQDMAAASKDDVVKIAFMRDERVIPLVELSNKADLILDARLIRPQGYVSPDRMDIYTDYEMVPSRILRSQIGDVSISKTPGTRAAFQLTVPGGEVTLAGKTVILSFVMQKAIRAGSRYLIFATRVNPADNRFVPTGGSGGIFEVLDNGRLNPILRTSRENPDFNDALFDEVARKVEAPGRSR